MKVFGEKKSDNFDALDDFDKEKEFRRRHSKKTYGVLGTIIFLVSGLSTLYHYYIINTKVDSFWKFEWRKEYDAEFILFIVSAIALVFMLISGFVAFLQVKRELGGYEPPHSGV